MAYTTINKSTDHFDIRTYSASGAGSISDVDFQPDFIWFKNRTIVGDHGLMDAVRGVNGIIHSNDANAEVTSNGTTNITAFTSNGFTYGASSLIDTGAGTPCTWLWKANGQGSSNTDGSINTTYTSVNTTAGFSISSFTGTGANATFGHGLGAVPKMYILKRYDSSNNWRVYHESIGNGKYMTLETTEVEQTSSGFTNNTSPTSSLISLGNLGSANPSGGSVICYAFAEKQGYSKFGSYVGNNNTDGTFVYTGFKPAFIMIKCTNSARAWQIHNNKSSPFNTSSQRLWANLTNAEANNTDLDLLSNGFKPRIVDDNTNGNLEYIYMAFAEAPLVGTNGVTAKAR